MSNKRMEYIAARLDSTGSVKVAELSRELNCSEVTIRSDIKKLEDKGLAKRIHGGAVKVGGQLMVPFDAGNVFKNSDRKRRIAWKAYEYIEDQDTIILDDSSVCYYLAQCIRDDSSKHLLVITNSLASAGVLSHLSHVELFLLGGQVGGKLASTVGDVAVNTLKGFRANKAFISAHGINFSVGLTSIGSPQMQVKKAVLAASDQAYVLADSSKFGGGYVMVVCSLDDISAIITDDGIKKEYLEEAEKQHVYIDVV